MQERRMLESTRLLDTNIQPKTRVGDENPSILFDGSTKQLVKNGSSRNVLDLLYASCVVELRICILVCSFIFGFSLGLIFSGAMIVLASAAILYTTSRIQQDYRTDQHVAASLSLFAAVAMLFWYMVRIFIATRD